MSLYLYIINLYVKKRMRLNHLIICFLCSLFAPVAEAQLVKHERILSFEDDSVPGFITGTNSDLSITASHFKDGSRSLNWKFAPGATLSIKKDLCFEPKDPTGTDTYLSGFVVWVHNTNPIGQPLTFQFRKNGRVCTSFDMGLDFTGWRTAWVCYERDMQGIAETGMDEITIVAPEAEGEICIDHLLTAAKMDHRHQTADEQVPFVNAATTSHWLVVYPNSKLRPDIPLEPEVTLGQEKDIDLLESRFRELIYHPVEVSDKTMGDIRRKYEAYGITRGANGQVKGLPLFFNRSAEAYERIVSDYDKNIFDRNGMELRAYFDLMNQIASAYHSTPDNSCRDELKQMFLAMYDHAADQGVAYGSCLGNFTHYGYSFRNYYTSYFLMKDVLKEAGKLAEAEKAMRWYSIANEVFVKPMQPGMDMDAFNTVTTGRIASILMMDNSPEKVQYLKSFSRWINNGCLPSHGLDGSFKSDGGAFHHRNLYPAYAIGGLNGATKMIYLLSNTSFAVSEQAHSTVKKVLLAMRFYCNKADFPLAMSGRHPDGKGTLVPMHYATMALAGTPDRTQPLDYDMGNAYLRLVTDNKTHRDDNPEYIPFVSGRQERAMIERLQALGCVSEPEPQGNWNLGYGCVNVHRRNNWSAVARGHSRYLWASEHYRGENLFGRYLAHGSLQIMTSPDSLTDVSSRTGGWVEEGFDWGRIPGATAIYLPLDELKANVLNVDTYSGYEEMLFSDESFAGGISQLGCNGAFGMKLHEHDKYNGSLRARKSYHFLDDKIVCLGTDIENTDNSHDTETTVFQLALTDNGARDYWNNPVKGENYILDHLNTGYYFLPLTESYYDKATLERHPDQQSVSNEGRPTSGNWISLTINHGRAPQNRRYHYAIVPQTDEATMAKFADYPTYEVLQQDRGAHIVHDTENNITSYVLFETPLQLPSGLVEHADTACLIMVKQVSDTEAVITVSNPDLALYRGEADEIFADNGKRIERSIYSRPWISAESQEIPVRVTLRGHWNITDNPACRIIAANKHSTTIEIPCKDAASFDIRLTR